MCCLATNMVPSQVHFYPFIFKFQGLLFKFCSYKQGEYFQSFTVKSRVQSIFTEYMPALSALSSSSIRGNTLNLLILTLLHMDLVFCILVEFTYQFSQLNFILLFSIQQCVCTYSFVCPHYFLQLSNTPLNGYQCLFNQLLTDKL